MSEFGRGDVIERMTDDQLREIEARAAAATPGPWHNCGADRGGCICGLVWTIPRDTVVADARKDGVLDCKGHWLGRDDVPETDYKADAAFVAHAREDVPALVAEVRALQAERDQLAAELQLLKAGFRPASEALVDEIAKHAETRRERDRLAAEVARLKQDRDEVAAESADAYWRIIAKEQIQRADRAEAEVTKLRQALPLLVAEALKNALAAWDRAAGVIHKSDWEGGAK